MGKEYEDMRDEYCRVLWDQAESLRFHAHDHSKRLVTVRALVQIACHDDEILTETQAGEIRGVGESIEKTLSKEARHGIPTECGRYATAALAMLSVLYEKKISCIKKKEKDALVSMGELLSKGQSKLESFRKFLALDLILSSPGACTAWAQMQPLESKGFVKRRQRINMEGKLAFELTDDGLEHVKHLLKERIGTGRIQKIEAVRSWHWQNSPFYVIVDHREGGGESVKLGSLTRRLQKEQVPFRTAVLNTGDYLFVRASDNKCFDAIVERKTAVDLADSIRDGRWKRQYTNMVEALNGQQSNHNLDMSGLERIVYLIEGDLKRYVHTQCGCGCMGVGKCGNPTVEKLRQALNEKRKISKVHVVETNHPKATTCWIKSTLEEIARKNGTPLTPTKKRKTSDIQDEVKVQPATVMTPSKKKSATCSKVSYAQLKVAATAWNERDRTQLTKLTLPVLKELCISTGENVSGTKAQIVSRLLEEPEPALLVLRRRQGEYIPRDRTAGHAFLCALDIAHRQGSIGLTKDDLMTRAEELGVFAGESLYYEVGPLGYTGWAVAKDLLSKGAVPLCKRISSSRYALNPIAGVDANRKFISPGTDIAAALHYKAHLRKYCKCKSPPPQTLEATRQITLEDILKDHPSSSNDDKTSTIFFKSTPPTKTKRKQSKGLFDSDDDDDIIYENTASLLPSLPVDDDDVIIYEPTKAPPSPQSISNDSDDDILDLTSDVDSPNSKARRRPPRTSNRSCIDLTLDDSSDSD
uniref:Crossover junction endonuclease MUS81 n=1 Tax=Aureoumbra lagunensis TaxID=44058 RepID=A0A7S3NF71_9STRA|mmetsp:Transcript_13100/g.19600  ORF Transcript_13100/g.19600 Transcript_13100/m.19600 type:complete len:755 (+) Transcript_13100:53-2317(+)